MKVEEINNKTNEAISYLVKALDAGDSEVLTEYLNAMARAWRKCLFHDSPLLGDAPLLPSDYNGRFSIFGNDCGLLRSVHLRSKRTLIRSVHLSSMDLYL